MRLRCLSLFLSMLCLLAFAASPAWSDENKERYIKVLGVDSENLHLEVDGRKLDIPLPDGYEPMPQEKYSKRYLQFIKEAKDAEKLPLCALVNMHEDQNNNDEHPAVKTAFFEIEHDYIGHRFLKGEFAREISNIKSINIETEKWANGQLKSMGRHPFTSNYIYEDEHCISLISIENEITSKKSIDWA